MKILVAGGGGYIGSVMVPMLREHGYFVTVADFGWFGDEGVDVKGDLFKLTSKDLSSYNQLIFLGGLSNDPMAEFDPSMNYIYNAALPAYLAYEFKKSSSDYKRFIYASTCSVYGYTQEELFDESAPTTCQYPYGVSKLQGEVGVLQQQSDDFSVVSLRQGTVCGYSPRMRFDLIVNTMYKCAMQDGLIKVNNPSIWRPLLDIRDTCNAFLRATQASEKVSGVFNVASDNYTVGQVADMVKAQVESLHPDRKIAVEINDVKDFRNYKVAWDKASTVLGFRPQYDVSDMITEINNHYVTDGYDFSDKKYYNIEVFKEANIKGNLLK